jgi:hypothetical protein
MAHSHNHTGHTWCIATIVYNILVIFIELILQVVFTEHDSHDLITVELRVQAFHFVGIISLGVLQWWIIHRLKKQTTWKFATISFMMVALHMLLLHVLPRIWGIVHLHDEQHHGATREVVVLLSVVVLVTILFRYRDRILDKFNLKNKWHIKKPFA